MPAILFPQRRQKQPGNAVGINRGNPFTIGTAFAWVPNVSKELVTGASPTLVNTGSYGVGQKGKHLAATANGFTANGASFTGTKSMLGSSTDPGVSFLVVLNSWSSTAGGVVGSLIGSSSATEGFGVDNTAHPYVRSAATHTSTRTISTATPYVLAANFIYGVGCVFWINGVSETIVADGGFSLGGAIDSIGGINGQVSIGANIALAWVWNRVLGDGEMKSLADNPWQLLQPFSRKWTISSGGGAAFAAKFRKTLSGYGSGVGKRQIHGWQ